MPGTVSELFPRRPCSLPGYDSQSTPHLLLPSPPRVLHSPIIRHSSCIFPSSASLTSPSSPVSNPPLSPRTATLSLSSPPPPHPISYSCCSALTIILLVHPAWPVNSHFHFSPSCFSCSPLCHPLTRFPGSAALSPAFRLEIGSGKQPGLG